jgi:hypothetical protein
MQGVMSQAPISAALTYLGPMSERPLSYTHARDRGNLNVERHVMAIHDLRHATSKLTLEKEGVILADLPLDVGNETNPNIIAAVYHPRLERLMRHASCAARRSGSRSADRSSCAQSSYTYPRGG